MSTSSWAYDEIERLKQYIHNNLKRFHRWTIPVGGDIGFIALPKRNMTEKEWNQMMAVIELFKQAIVVDEQATP